jgi:hypothetical protein
MNAVVVVVNALVLASVLLKYVKYKIKVVKTSKKRSLLFYDLYLNRFGIKNCFSFDFSTDRFIDPSNGESHKKDESCLTLTLTQCYARLHLSRNVFSLIIHFRVYPSNRLNLKNVLDIPFWNQILPKQICTHCERVFVNQFWKSMKYHFFYNHAHEW